MSGRGVRAVILAAGTSSRVGKQKLLMNFRGVPLIERALAAAQRWDPLVVAGPEVAAYLAGRAGLEVVRNDEPERGMSHSLALANRCVPDDVATVVLLGDKPLVSEQLIATICRAAGDADVAFPVRDSEPGHPVLLSVRARRFVDALPSGDTLRALRDDPRLTSLAIETRDEGAFFDVDTLGVLDA
jgi:molybdenum cofactor cytidylyltransferase